MESAVCGTTKILTLPVLMSVVYVAIASPVELTPVEYIKLFVPSCTTNNSAVSNLELAVFLIDTMYLALLNVALAKLSSTEADELANVAVPEVCTVMSFVVTEVDVKAPAKPVAVIIPVLLLNVKLDPLLTA